MKLIADKLTHSLAIEGELTDKGLAAISESSESVTKELAKMLVEKSEDNRNLKDLWAAYRKKEVQIECRITDSKPMEIPEKVREPEGEKTKTKRRSRADRQQSGQGPVH